MSDAPVIHRRAGSGLFLLSRPPRLAAVPVPTGALYRVFELLGHTAVFAYPFAGRAVGLVDHPVVHAIGNCLLNCLFGHRCYPLSQPSLRRWWARLTPVSDGHIGDIHRPCVLEPGPEKDVVFELFDDLGGPAGYAAHGEDGNKQVVRDPHKVVYRP